MGTKISVGSLAYNLAGDPLQRPNYLKNTIIAGVMDSSDPLLGGYVVDGHINGPAASLMSFSRWAESSGYNAAVGNRDALITKKTVVSSTLLRSMVSGDPSTIYKNIFTTRGALDYFQVGLKHVQDNYPLLALKEFDVDIETVNVIDYTAYPFRNKVVPTGKLIIKFAEEVPAISDIVFTSPYTIPNNGEYVHINYDEAISTVPVSIIKTPWTVVASKPEFPITIDYVGSYTITPNIESLITLVETTVTYSDSTPGSSSVDSSTEVRTINSEVGVFDKTTTTIDTDGITRLVLIERVNAEVNYTIVTETNTVTTNEDIGGGVIKTTVVTTTEDVNYFEYKYKETEITSEEDNYVERTHIYLIGSNPTYDAALTLDSPYSFGKLLPVIPMRHHNNFVDAAHYPDQYARGKKALSKAMGGRKTYDKLIDSLNENEGIGDIDHAWVVFGTSLGSSSQASKAYAYSFFSELVENSDLTLGHTKDISAFTAAQTTYVNALNYRKTHPNSPLPTMGATLQSYVVRSNTSGSAWAYDITIRAEGGAKYTGTGFHIKSGSKVGNCWVYKTYDRPFIYYPYGRFGFLYRNTGAQDLAVIRVGKQITENSWIEYEFTNVTHTNNVFEGTSAITLAGNAIGVEDENNPFILPMIERIFKETPLFARNQLATECNYLVINYYVITKTKWYQSGIFKIFIFIATIVVGVMTGFITPQSVGVFGSAGSVGASITGLAATSLTATIVGAAVNAIAATIILSIVERVVIKLFGNGFLGRILSIVATMVAISYVSGPESFNFSDFAHEFTKADNLIKFGNSIVGAFNEDMMQKTQKIYESIGIMLQEYKTKSDEIFKLSAEMLGNTGVDPLMLANAMASQATETEMEFLERTLLTGDRVAKITLDLVETFPVQQLKLPYT